MTFTATPQPANLPPRVRLDIDTDDPGGSFTQLSVTRDNVLLREQPFVGGPVTAVFDYEAPFGVPVTYEVDGEFLPTLTPFWTEAWANLSSWTGDTASFSTSGGKARSSVLAAQIVRTAVGTIERLSVTSPSYVRLELLDASNVVVASIQTTTNTLLAGTASATASGVGTYTATLINGVLSVSGTGWSGTVAYTGTPVKVRVVGLGVAYELTSSFAVGGVPAGLDVDSSGNIYVADYSGKFVRKFNSTGTQTAAFATSGNPTVLKVDASGNIYVGMETPNQVQKLTSAGAVTYTIALSAPPGGVGVDSTNRPYVSTNGIVTRYNSSGASGATFITTSRPRGIAIDASDNVYVANDFSGGGVRKYNSAGTFLSNVGPEKVRQVEVDSAGNIFVSGTFGAVRKYSSALVEQPGPPGTPATGQGVAVDSSGNLYTSDAATSQIRKFAPVTPSVGAIAPTPAAMAQSFSATATTTLSVDEAWLIHPTFPTLSRSIDPGQHKFRDVGINVDATTKASKSRGARATRHDPIGARRPVFITSGPRAAPEWDLRLRVRSLVDRDDVEALVEDQTPLLLRSPPGWLWDLPDDWYAVGDYTEERPRPRLDSADRIVTLPLVAVDSPVVRAAAVWTYGSDLLAYPTYGASRAAQPTYLDRLVGPQS